MGENKALDPDKLRQLQMIEVEILDEFVRICEKYHLTYYLYFGTLLGAVRHKGFIPWDDDMDVVLPRRDYERFCEVVQQEIRPEFFAQNYRSDPGYPGGALRIRKRGTKYISDYTARLKLKDYGIMIDVAAIDNVSNPKSIKFFLCAVINKQIIERLAGHRAVTNSKGRSPMRKVADFASRILPLRGWNRLCDQLYKIDSNDASKQCVVFFSTYSCRKNLMPREVFGEPVKVEFEGKQYNAPQNWDYVLRHIYGNYMQLPPPEERKNHTPMIWEM